MSNDITGSNNSGGSSNVSKDEPADKIEIIISQADIQTYLFVTTGYCSGFIPFRSFAEKDSDIEDAKPINRWIASDDNVVSIAMKFANLAHHNKMGCFIIPGTVAKVGQAKAEDIIQMQTLLIDIDTENTKEKLELLTEHIGTPTLVVESGGITDEGYRKLHIYWQLSRAVEGEQLQKLVELRAIMARAAKGDGHFNSAHQPIRVAGSVYYKGGAQKLVRIQAYEPIEYEFGELEDGVKRLVQAKADLSIPTVDADTYDNTKSNTSPDLAPINEILIQKVYEGGTGENTRFKNISRVIGFWIRRYHDGMVSREMAYEEIKSFNLARGMPSWPEERLEREIAALDKLHAKKHDKNGGNPEALKSAKPVRINPTTWKGLTPPTREWIVEDWLPRGCVTAIYGDGGVGKTLLAQQLTTCLATGRTFLGKQLKPGRIYAVMCEDDDDELWRRQVTINKHYGIDMDELGNIDYVSRVGEDSLLMTFDHGASGRFTEFFNNIYQDILEIKPDLVILDTAADSFGGNENARSEVRQFIRNVCGKIARATKAAVLLCAHPSENGMQKGTGTGGSTAWNNTVRARWYLKPFDDDNYDDKRRILTRVKSNYSADGTVIYLELKDGVLIELNLKDIEQNNANKGTPISSRCSSPDKQDRIILSALTKEAARGRVYSIGSFCEAYKGYAGLGGKDAIRERINTLMKRGYVKIFRNVADYGIASSTSKYGLMCVEGMELLKSNGERQKVLPTHYMHHISGNLITIQNPDIWPTGKEVEDMD